jgi:small subunit ribosomal protein S16
LLYTKFDKNHCEMPVKIRLQPRGKKRQKIYDIVVADSRSSRNGRIIEKVGQYIPFTTPAEVVLNFEKALNWLQKGALPSDTVKSILKHKGVIYKNHLLNGVKKGAFSEYEAQQRFDKWYDLKIKKTKNLIDYYVDNEVYRKGTEEWRNLKSEDKIKIERETKKVSITTIPLQSEIKLEKKNRFYHEFTSEIEPKGITDMHDNPYSLKVNVFLNNEDGNNLEIDKEYSLTVGVSIDDKLNRSEILNKFIVMLQPSKTEILGSPFNKIAFDKQKNGSSEFKIIPRRLGETVFNIDFIQDTELVKSLPLQFNILNP